MRFISYAFSPDGKSVAIASCQKVDDAAAYCIEGQTILLDIASGQVAQTFEGDGQAIAFSPDGHLLAVSAFGNIVLWDTLSGQRLFTLPGNSSDIVSLEFSPDGHLLVSGEHDQGENFLAWDTTTGQLLFTKNYSFYISSVSFSPDGKYIAIARLGSPLLLGLP
jgi:WD40 repeat protein